MRKKRRRVSFGTALAVTFFVTLAAVLLAFFLAAIITFRGPSESFALAAREQLSYSPLTAWIPDTFSKKEADEETDTAVSLIEEPSVTETPVIATPEPTPEPTPTPVPGPVPDPYGLLDEDGDGIVFNKTNYKGSTINTITIYDPGRVFVGTCVDSPDSYGYGGLTLDIMVEKYDALGGINGGGFLDEGGGGGGWPPEGIVYSNGDCYWSEQYGPSAILTWDNKLYVGYYSYEECQSLGARDVVSFGPVLVTNGVKADESEMWTGINPRTAIGQRADGAIVMMCVDGRQAYSIGVAYADCVEIMYNLGCLNAVCMDGGNSSCMFLNGELINHPSNQAGGTRYLPTAWLIRK